MVTVGVAVWLQRWGAGCLDRDLFQHERQRALVGGLLLLVLAAAGGDALVLMARGLIPFAVHQN